MASLRLAERRRGGGSPGLTGNPRGPLPLISRNDNQQTTCVEGWSSSRKSAVGNRAWWVQTVTDGWCRPPRMAAARRAACPTQPPWGGEAQAWEGASHSPGASSARRARRAGGWGKRGCAWVTCGRRWKRVRALRARAPSSVRHTTRQAHAGVETPSGLDARPSSAARRAPRAEERARRAATSS